VQTDPLLNQNPRDPQTANRYAYARNNPLRFLDPTAAMDADIIITKPGMTWHEALGIELPSTSSEADTVTEPTEPDKPPKPSSDRDDIILTKPGQTWQSALGTQVSPRNLGTQSTTTQDTTTTSTAPPTDAHAWGAIHIIVGCAIFSACVMIMIAFPPASVASTLIAGFIAVPLIRRGVLELWS
jgi:hypothetical protein